MPDRQVAGAGNKFGFLGFLDNDMILTGSTPTAPGAASAANGGMARILGIKRAALNVPEPDTVIQGWDDDSFAEFTFKSIASRRFLVDVAIQDLAFAALLQDTVVTTLGGVNFGYLDVDNLPIYNLCGILQSRALKERTSDRGGRAWTGSVVNVLQGMALGRVQYNEREVAVFRFSLTPNLASHHPWGTTIYDTNSVIRNAVSDPFDSDYPITFHRSTGALAIIPVDYTPVNVASCWAFTERVANVVSSVSAAAKTITLTTTPGAPQRTVTSYQFSSE